MLIVVNLNANGGKGIQKWRKVKKYLDDNKVSYHAILSASYEDSVQELEKEIHKGEGQTIVAAGGDGTMNGILNYLMKKNLFQKNIKFGAIGLGSSNDFHKPFKDTRYIDGIPVILPTHSVNQKWDVGRAYYTDENGQKQEHFFAINSSIGLTANGNDFFNHKSWFLDLLKRVHLEVANAWTILNILLKFKSHSIQFDGVDELTNAKLPLEIDACNIGVLKKTNVSGGMCYDTLVKHDDGKLDVVICEKLDRIGILKIVANLYKGKFRGSKKTQYFQTSNLKITFPELMNLEFDGEVVKAKDVEYNVLKEAIEIC